MKHLLLAIFGFEALLVSCLPSSAAGPGPSSPKRPTTAESAVERPAPRPSPPPEDPMQRRIRIAEEGATPGGRAVLAAARQMIAEDKVVKGSCWDYAYAVYRRAGFGTWRRQQIPYRAKTKGPYADPRLVQAGDWIYLINHVATLATHSVIFVHWVDFPSRRAMVVTYVGGGREESGYYREYDLSRIYQITRPKVP